MENKTGKLSHIEIYVSDLKQSIEFWGWLLEKLGYSMYQEWDKGRSWKLDETYIVFVQAEDKYLNEGYHRKRVGLNHLAFYVESNDQIQEFMKELEKRDIKILYKEKNIDKNTLFFEDPDRIKVEINS